MGSLIAEALGGTGLLDGGQQRNIEDKVRQLEVSVTDARNEIVSTLKAVYVGGETEVLLSRFRSLSARVDALNERTRTDLERLREQLRQLDHNAQHQQRNVGDNIGSLECQLSSTEQCLSSLTALVEVSSLLDDVDVLSPSDVPLQCANAINDLSVRLDALKDKGFTDDQDAAINNMWTADGRVVEALFAELSIVKERLIYELLEWWSDTFQWTEKDGVKRLVITEAVGANEIGEFSQKLSAMHIVGYLDEKMTRFGDSLLSNLCNGITEDNSKLTITDETGSRAMAKRKKVFEVISPPANAEKTGGGDEPLTTLAKNKLNSLMLLFDTLYVAVGQLHIDTTSGEGESTRRTFLTLCGHKCADGLMRMLVKDVVKPAIPFDKDQQPLFDSVLSQATALETRLKEIGLLPATVNSFEQLAEDFDTLFLDRRCLRILGEGRTLILSELHNFVPVGSDGGDDHKSAQGFVDEFHRTYVENSQQSTETGSRSIVQLKLPSFFHFPRCQVSSSVVDLASLLEQTLEDACATEITPTGAGRLFETARNLMELYLELTQDAHRLQLNSVPQLAAVFYNNCYYLTHRLMTLGYETSPRLNKKLGGGPSIITFVDFVPRLREVASDCLQLHLDARRRDIECAIKGQHIFENLSKTDAVSDCEKILRGCTLQLEQTHRVWNEVLTRWVLLKATGTLANHLLGLLYADIVDIEDIPASDCDIIADLLGKTLSVLERLFAVDKRSSEIHRHCPKTYFATKELISCLKGSLQEISDRWCGGKGPLAQWMEAAHIRSLVKALFQNTEKRAAILAQIQ